MYAAIISKISLFYRSLILMRAIPPDAALPYYLICLQNTKIGDKIFIKYFALMQLGFVIITDMMASLALRSVQYNSVFK